MVQAAVTTVRPSRLIGLQQQHHGRAVRVFFIDEAQGFDQHVRFVDIGFEQLLRRFMAYKITLEIAACRMDDLLRSKRPAGMTAHAIRHNGQHNVTARVRKQDHTILLFGAVALMLRNTGINTNRRLLF